MKRFPNFKKKSTDYGLKLEPQYAYLDFEIGEELVIMMQASQIRSGNYRHKAMPFSLGNERSREEKNKTAQKCIPFISTWCNRFTTIYSITILSSFVGESARKEKKKKDGIHNTATHNNIVDDNDI
ncbi:unnamed protein product [Rotaria sp. Silwood1]|nr:unnamed protein product [Rotaria sp. Silwood1]CAF1681762.1 unnamed protein product [Rotaria sp. Silwood1]